MAKSPDFPRASLKRSLELAAAVQALGGECTGEMCASALGRAPQSGPFKTLISSAIRFGLLRRKGDKVSTTERYREYHLAYNPEQAKQVLKEAFLGISMFQRICIRFSGVKLPVDIMDKLLIREFGVPDAIGSRIAKYFIEGARQAGLLDESGLVTPFNSVDASAEERLEQPTETVQAEPRSSIDTQPAPFKHYSVVIQGPGMNSEISILEPEDLAIVNAMLMKIKRKLENSNDMD